MRTNHLLRCQGWLSLLNLVGALTLSLLLKLPLGKLEPWFVLWSVFLLRWLCISINLPYIIHGILVMSGLMLLVTPILKSWFQFCYNIHVYSTTFFMKDHPYKKSFKTNNFGKFSITASAIDSWNKM